MGLFGSQQEEQQQALIDTPQIREAFAQCRQGGPDVLKAQAELSALVLCEVIRKMTVVVLVPDPSLYDDASELEDVERKRAWEESRAAAKGETLGVIAAQRLRNKELDAKSRHAARMRFRTTQQELIRKICASGYRGGGPCTVGEQVMYCYQGCLNPQGPEDLAKIVDMQLLDADSLNDNVANYKAPIPGSKKETVGMLVGNSVADQRRAIREGYALLQSAGVDEDRFEPELRYNVKTLKTLNDKAMQSEQQQQQRQEQQAANDKAQTQTSKRILGVFLIVAGIIWAFLNVIMLMIGSGSAVSVLLNVAAVALGVLLLRKKKDATSATPSQAASPSQPTRPSWAAPMAPAPSAATPMQPMQSVQPPAQPLPPMQPAQQVPFVQPMPPMPQAPYAQPVQPLPPMPLPAESTPRQ